MSMIKRTETVATATSTTTTAAKPAKKFCARIGGCSVQIRPCDEFCRSHEREGYRAKTIAASQARINPVVARQTAARENAAAVIDTWRLGWDLPEGVTVTKNGERQYLIRFPGGSVTYCGPKQ